MHLSIRSLDVHLLVAASLFALVLGCQLDPIVEYDPNRIQDDSTTNDTQGEGGSADQGCQVGVLGCPCTEGGGCEPGLVCSEGVCGPPDCPIGSQGCPCTGGGACDPGLTCEAGLCLPGGGTTGDGDGDGDTGQDGDGDTGQDGDGDTGGSTDGDTGDGFMCKLSDWCGYPDVSDCECFGCWTDNYCTSDEDCVCPDCTQFSVCRGGNCVTNGACHPYIEGCDCPDCADHPLCN